MVQVCTLRDPKMSEDLRRHRWFDVNLDVIISSKSHGEQRRGERLKKILRSSSWDHREVEEVIWSGMMAHCTV